MKKKIPSLEQIKKFIDSVWDKHQGFIGYADLGKRYYEGKNDILDIKLYSEEEDNPRTANRRVPSRIFHLLVEQKWYFMFGGQTRYYTHYNEKIEEVEDIVHTHNEEHKHTEVDEKTILDRKVNQVLGNRIDEVWRKLCIDASTSGVAYLHYWKTGTHFKDSEDKGEFMFDAIDPRGVVVELDEYGEIILALRHYKRVNPEDGVTYDFYDYMNREYIMSFYKDTNDSVEKGLRPYDRYYYYSSENNEEYTSNVYKHGFDKVPIIEFRNNELKNSDLEGLKPLIDAFDLARTQFTNDQEDFQKIIFILSGYGKEPADGFLDKLKQHKLVKLESGYPDQIEPKLDTLQVEIPVDAYKTAIEMYKKAIYEEGMGLDVSSDDLSYTNGEALEFRYSLLQLKATGTMIQFKHGFRKLIKAIAKHLGYEIEEKQIEIQWLPGEVQNQNDLTNNARLCLGFTSLQTALKVNPYVNDVEEEMKLIEKERQEALEQELPNIDDVRVTGDRLNLYRGTSSERQKTYQENRSESEVKSKEPEKYTQAKKITNSTNIVK